MLRITVVLLATACLLTPPLALSAPTVGGSQVLNKHTKSDQYYEPIDIVKADNNGVQLWILDSDADVGDIERDNNIPDNIVVVIPKGFVTLPVPVGKKGSQLVKYLLGKVVPKGGIKSQVKKVEYLKERMKQAGMKTLKVSKNQKDINVDLGFYLDKDEKLYSLN